MTPAEDAEFNKYYAVLSYFGLLFLFPLILRPHSRFCQFHARQGLIFCILILFYGLLVQLPLIGWFIIAPIGGLITIILFVYGTANAMSGRTEVLPLIGKYAKKSKLL